MMSEDRCVCCGAIVPEGRMVCPICEDQHDKETLRDDEEYRMRLYCLGLSDQEIADRLGIRKSAVASWRRRRQLPCNRLPGPQRKQWRR